MNKTLKRVISFFCFLSSILLYVPAYAQSELRITWGLESKLHQETKATSRQNRAGWPKAGRGEKLYRYFKPKDTYDSISEDMMRRHFPLWHAFEKTLAKGQSPVKKDYVRFARKNDPYFNGLIDLLAPVLYFDFTGTSGTEYILNSIKVSTINFEEYSGGGFALDEAWYDITLPLKGQKTFSVGKKLKFTGSGRARLRLFSSNYYPNVGITPMGCYMIDIQFNFTVDNRPVSVSTGPFKVDV